MTRVLTEEQKQRNRERARRWALENPERYKAKQAAHYQENADHLKQRARERRVEKIDEVRAYDRTRAAQGRAEKKEYDRAYRAANAEKIREDKARWVKTPEGRASVNANSVRRRARLKQADCGCASAKALHAVWEHDHGLCYACGAPGTSFDHVAPLSAGGLHCVTNLRVACRSCNSTKSHRDIDYLVERLVARGKTISPYLQLPALPCPKRRTS